MSGIGKGVATASIAAILQDRGFRVSCMKIDPYLNVDAGTMNPIEHGEVFVTKDGLETDQDLGNYERFLGRALARHNYMTTGIVYQSVIERERNLEYGGKCVEVVPHITDEILSRLETAVRKDRPHFLLVEVGGTVGEYQNLIFLEAARMLKLRRPGDVLFVMVSYLPIPEKIGEMKTKPTQYAVRSLNTAGIQPDMILARASRPLDAPRKRKLSLFCNVSEEDIISAPDVESIYEIPVNFEKERLGERILAKCGLPRLARLANESRRVSGKADYKKKANGLHAWREALARQRRATKPARVGIAGKYFMSGAFTLSDSYISVIEALKHATWAQGRTPELVWLDTESYETNPKKIEELSAMDGIVVPGGFGSRGVEGKIKVIQYAREHNIPFLGLCYGMHLAVVEFARNVAGMLKAHTTEVDPATLFPIVDALPEQAINIDAKRYGGSMRLGGYACLLVKGTRAHACYQSAGWRMPRVIERHRHRYEINNELFRELEIKGLRASGVNPERTLIEIVELPDHPFFIATQFHPEFQSHFLAPHPLFRGFIEAAIKNAK